MMTGASTPKSKQAPLKRGRWSPEEDMKLVAYINRYGIWNWNEMTKAAGLSRSGKSCRLRWMNYLTPNIKRGNITKEEEQTIINLHEILGNKWSAIATRLPGRTDNEIKNFWHTHMRKLLRNNPTNQQLQQMNTSEADVSNSSCTIPEASCSERSSVISMSSKSFSTADSSTNSYDQIIEDVNVRLPELAGDPIKSFMGLPSSSCNPDRENDESQSRGVCAGQVQNWRERPFSSEELEILENYGTTDPFHMWLEDTIYPHATLSEYNNDFWMNF